MENRNAQSPNGQNATRQTTITQVNASEAQPPEVQDTPEPANSTVPPHASNGAAVNGFGALSATKGDAANGVNNLGDGLEDLSSVLTPVEGEPPVENLNSLFAAPSALTHCYMRSGDSLTARLAQPRAMVRVGVHWMDESGRSVPVRCNQEPERPCVACIAGYGRVVYAHVPVYAVQQRAIVALQAPFETTPGALLPQLSRESNDPNAGRLLLTITRASRGQKYEVRRVRILGTTEVIGDREIEDFMARGGLRARDVRDMYEGLNNAELMARWPQVADLIRVHHPDVDVGAL